MSIRIICLGNRYFLPDSCGPAVFDLLQKMELPMALEVIDGGLNGLNLLALLENVDQVIFVDSVEGFLPEGGVVIIEDPVHYLDWDGTHDHNSGLAYLLRSAPLALESSMPGIYLVGIEGEVTGKILQEAAAKCLHLAQNLLQDSAVTG